MSNWTSRDKVLKFLDYYSSDVKDQIDSGKTRQPLLKSYIFETFNADILEETSNQELSAFNMTELMRSDEYAPIQIDEQFYYLLRGGETVGFIEEINNRFSILYSIDAANRSDKYTSSLVKHSTILDSLWISGIMFDGFLNKKIQLDHPNRYIKMKFEYDSFFEGNHFRKGFKKLNDDDETTFEEHRVSSTTLVEVASEIVEKISGVRELLPSFHSVGLLRFPNKLGKGGHEFYQNGKVTNRSDSFLDHRNQIIETVGAYQTITEHIEKTAWVNFETIRSTDISNSLSFSGSPVTIRFSKPLRDGLFSNFVNGIFEKGKEPFRILGKPIWVDENRAHIYGIDLHLWQKVMIDLSREQFTIFIPRGTCGNTIHRLVTNIQRYLDPRIRVYIGNMDYKRIIEQVIEEGDEFDK
ncbi:hypothetical protein [Brevibacillus porteri]|uniref:hypothetical protein n=1 Tax=Brevibacillus porteri TaxID=2126350 RepID=UPI003D21C770